MQFYVATMIGRAALRLVDRLGVNRIAALPSDRMHVVRQIPDARSCGANCKIGCSPAVVIITGAFTGAVLEAQTLFQLQTVRMETMGGRRRRRGHVPGTGARHYRADACGPRRVRHGSGNRDHESHGTGRRP